MKLDDLLTRLGACDLERPAREALDHAARQLADAVRVTLSDRPPGPHDVPWMISGELRDSIGSTMGENEALVGSTSPIAAYQEFGTSTIPPRPFLAPVALDQAGIIARNVATAVKDALATAVGSPVRDA